MKRTRISPLFEIRLNRTLHMVREDQKRNCIVFLFCILLKKSDYNDVCANKSRIHIAEYFHKVITLEWIRKNIKFISYLR